jgi:hypothetical protein
MGIDSECGLDAFWAFRLAPCTVIFSRALRLKGPAVRDIVSASASVNLPTTKTELPNNSGGRIGCAARRSTTARAMNDPMAARPSPSTGAENQA